MPRRPRITLSQRTKRLLGLYNDNRIKILVALCKSQNIECGTDLVYQTNIQKSLLTYHMKYLVQMGYVEEVKCGRFKNYKITKRSFLKVRNTLELLEVKL